MAKTQQQLKMLGVRMPPDLIKKIKVKAIAEDMTVEKLVTETLRANL